MHPRRPRSRENAEFFSFGTNDLTQTALGVSRDDAEGKFLTRYLDDGVMEHNPFEVLDHDGVGELMRIAVERGRAAQARPEDRHLRRARRRAPLGRASATASGSTTSRARRSASRSPASRPRRRRSTRGGHGEVRRRRRLIAAVTAALALTSPAFAGGGRIPVRYTCDGAGPRRRSGGRRRRGGRAASR